MFSWQHFVWLFICVALIVVIVRFYDKKRPRISQVLTTSCVICVLSEITKIFSVVEMVPSANGALIYPYIPLNHLPLHFCSFQILTIFYAKFSMDEARRENVTAFLSPTGVIGGFLALMMPSIFSTSITVRQAFTAPIAYQFFLYHAMLIALGICILHSDEVHWRKEHMYGSIITVFLLAFFSLYINSMMASPTYVDGELISVDFWTNFFFTYQNPLGIRLTEKWQWMLYLVIIAVLAAGSIGAYFRFLIFRKERKK